MIHPSVGALRHLILVGTLGAGTAMAEAPRALPSPAPPSPVPPSSETPPCQCRDPHGVRRDLGTVECVAIGRSRYLVRCEMSTNTPYWRRLLDDAGCPAPS